MKNQSHYKTLIPLINLILTDSKKIQIKKGNIHLSDSYLASLNADQNSHLYEYIFNYVESLNKEHKRDIIKIIIENDILFNTAFISTILENKEVIDANEGISTKKESILFKFILNEETHYTIYRFLYLYLENICNQNIQNQMLSENEYLDILNYNSKPRDKNDLLNMFI